MNETENQPVEQVKENILRALLFGTGAGIIAAIVWVGIMMATGIVLLGGFGGGFIAAIFAVAISSAYKLGPARKNIVGFILMLIITIILSSVVVLFGIGIVVHGEVSQFLDITVFESTSMVLDSMLSGDFDFSLPVIIDLLISIGFPVFILFAAIFGKEKEKKKKDA